MSKMSDFYAKAMQDEALKGQIAGILSGMPLESADDEQLAKIGEIAKGLGFDISVEEAKEYLGMDEEELSDEALGAVAGGQGVYDGKVDFDAPRDDEKMSNWQVLSEYLERKYNK